jgi:tetratricopeptide (TPR) repeat protein
MLSLSKKAMLWIGIAIAFVLMLAVSPLSPRAGAQVSEPGGASNPCALGDALKEAGEAKGAKKAYVEVMEQNSSSACAAAGLKELNAPPKEDPKVDQCAVGDAYRSVDRDDDAIAAYKKALEEDPKSDCAKQGLEAAGPNWFTRDIEAVTGSIPTVLVAIGLLLLLGYLVLALCRWRDFKQFLVRLGPVGRWVKRLLRPRLTFTDFADGAVEGSPGGPLTARVKERLGRMRDEALARAPEYDLDFGTPREDFADQVAENKTLKTALDSAGEVSEQTKMITALIGMFSVALPIRRFAVSGSLEPPAKSGAALTLMIGEEGRSEASTRLQGPADEKEDPKAKDYMTLADPAAVWIQYEIACSLNGDDWSPTKAESQAVLREGLDLCRRENLEAARKAFEKAISLDHTNWGAYVSLAVAEARIGGNYAKSVARILTGIERMRKAYA